MMKYGFVLFIAAVLIVACNNNNKKRDDFQSRQNVTIFSWLNGQWAMTEKEGTITEEWKPVNDSLMEGKSDLVTGDSVIPFETIRIFREDTEFYYEAKAAGQNKEQPVVFKVTSFSDTGFVAENPQHDFPKRISYTLINKDSIHAFVDGGAAMPNKKSDYYYSRVKN
ncbi:MAG TPA: DUF6265 family protein [Chitinophagaceae bacterium]|nr:DUF6265 family protein [Chitinophagaceae bacterium]